MKVGPWPDMEAALEALTASDERVASIKRRITQANATVALKRRERAELVRRTAEGDETAPAEAVRAKVDIDEAEAASAMLTEALPAAEKAAKEAEAAVCSLQDGIYWSESKSADLALQKAIEEADAAVARRVAAGQVAERARCAVNLQSHLLLAQAKAGERLDSLL